ncbi:hypothetical protein [Cellulosimicrobium sp. Marseille-Q8652]
MTSLHTPSDLAAEVGVSRAAVYAWLRATFPPPFEGRWILDEEQADQVRAHFAMTAPARGRRARACTVDGCDLRAVARGWCRLHYNRWHRTGSVDGVGSGGHQAAKTHCPHGHEYTPENTIVYPSDGRRRCRTCREGR